MKIKLIILLALIPFNLLKAQNSNLDEGLILYYPFNGNSKDESGNGNDGIVNGAMINSDKDGNSGKAYYLDGKDDYIQIKNNNDFNADEMTVSLWFKKNNSVTGKSYVERETRGLIFMGRQTNHYSRRFALSITEQSPYNLVGDLSNGKDLTFIGAANAIKPDVWYHGVMTFNNKVFKLYLNGELASEVKVNGPVAKIADDIVIGKVSMRSHHNRYFDGLVDELRIYKRVLNECEIVNLYQYNPISPKQKITNYVEGNLKEWSKKDEYETTDNYNLRIKNDKDNKKAEFELEAIKSISDEIKWQCGIKKYNADNQQFELNYNNVEPFVLSVPAKEAKEFGENFRKLKYLNPEFIIGDKPNLIVDCITIKNQVNGKEYKYGCEKIPPNPKPDPTAPNTPTFSNSTVTVKIWDEQKEDGDIVSVFLNGARIKKEITVKKSEHIFTLELKKGMNTVKLLAHNEGKTSPNTAAILIDDGVKEYKTVLSSKKGESAELKIVLE